MMMIRRKEGGNPNSCFLPPSSVGLSPTFARHLWSFKDEQRFLKLSLNEPTCPPLNNAPLALRVSSKIALLPRGSEGDTSPIGGHTASSDAEMALDGFWVPFPSQVIHTPPEVANNDIDQMLQRAQVRHLEIRGVNTHTNLAI